MASFQTTTTAASGPYEFERQIVKVRLEARVLGKLTKLSVGESHFAELLFKRTPELQASAKGVKSASLRKI